MKHAALLMSIALLIPLLLGTGSNTARSTNATFHSMDPISLVGIDKDGRVDFRGTIVFFGSGKQMTCAYNLVIQDCRGEINSAIKNCWGFSAIGRTNAETENSSNIIFSFRLHPGSVDGFLEVAIDETTPSGTWEFLSGGEPTMSGTCLTWSRTLPEEVRPHAKTADDLVQYWRTPRKQDSYPDLPPPVED